MRRAPLLCLAVLSFACMGFWLPRLYDTLMFERMERTQLFYSPLLERFIYTEKAPRFDPEAASKAEDHHSDIVYKDQNGVYYDRLEFERLLPFIYYRNMALRGYLPLDIQGLSLDEEHIRRERLVLELAARHIRGKTPSEEVWPLLESQPGQAGLIFPDDRFRMTDNAMEFINADYNTVDRQLTERFTKALLEKGFVFPCRLVAGNFTILKAYEGGVFLVDAENKVFHLLRVHNQPQLTLTALDTALAPRHIAVSENRSGRFHGLLLAGDGVLHLISKDNYRAVPLPLEGYNPDSMDFKVIFDPLYRTAVYSDEQVVRAVVMDRQYAPLASYEHVMSSGLRNWKHVLRDMLFPFSLEFSSASSRMEQIRVGFSLRFWRFTFLGGVLLALGYVLVRKLRGEAPPPLVALALTCVTSVYGLVFWGFFGRESA